MWLFILFYFCELAIQYGVEATEHTKAEQKTQKIAYNTKAEKDFVVKSL